MMATSVNPGLKIIMIIMILMIMIMLISLISIITFTMKIYSRAFYIPKTDRDPRAPRRRRRAKVLLV